MTDVSLPSSMTLADGYETPQQETCWTVREIIEMLQEYDQDALVWVDRSRLPHEFEDEQAYYDAPWVVAPVESVHGQNGIVVLG